MRLYRLAADQGNAIAQNNLGVMYRDGRGVPQNGSEAVRVFRLAADQGLAEAQFSLGVMYDDGRDVPQNDSEAVRWYRLAADQGNAFAQNNLGVMYRDGRGVPQNDSEAVRWYRLAADQGNAFAQNNLGAMYRAGRGVPQNGSEAVRWYRLAADQGNAIAQSNLGYMYQEGRGVPKDEKEAAGWYRKAADIRVEAMVALGDCYLLGRGIEQNIATAQSFYIKAAELGYDDAQKGIRITATRGYLRSPLNVRSDSGNILVGRNEYVIFLPEKKRVLHPHEGTFTLTPDIAEGAKVTVDTKVKEGSGTAEVHISFKTDFLIKKLLLDGASIPFDDIETSDTPEFIKSKASFTISDRQLTDGFAMTLISRENAEHVRRLEYRDGTLKVISSRDLSNF